MIDLSAMVAAITDDATWCEPLSTAAETWAIKTDTRAQMWLAQCAHESAGLTRLVENLRYSAKALRATWPSRFKNDAEMLQYNERAIGERAYGGRMGNGPEGSGDGYLYRGRGIIQITGRSKYRDCGRALLINLEAAPDLLEQQTWAAQSAGWFWRTHGLNELADSMQFVAISKIINGGLNGIEDRMAWLDKVQAA